MVTINVVLHYFVGTDILYKKSSDYNDPLSHLKTFVWIEMIMAPAGGIMALCSDTLLDFVMMVKDTRIENNLK